jgi:hypothetical protein
MKTISLKSNATIQVDRLKAEGNKAEALPFISFRVENT